MALSAWSVLILRFHKHAKDISKLLVPAGLPL